MPEYPSGGGGAGAGVSTFNGRSGAVSPALNDYAVGQLANPGAVAGQDLTWNGAALVPFEPFQDATGRAGSLNAASLYQGVGGTTKIAAGSIGVSLNTLAGGTALQVLSTAAFESPSGPNYGPSPQTITVPTSVGNAVLSFTGSTAGTFTGIAIVSGTGTATIVAGTVRAQGMPLIDVFMGDSLIRGDAATFGVNDAATLLCTTENTQAGLIPPGPCFVMPFLNEGVWGNFQWSNTGAGAAVTTGSPTCGVGGAAPGTVPYASSVKLTGTQQVGDVRSFRRMIAFFLNVTNGDKVTFATTGAVVSSGALSTAGTPGVNFWDSGDLGSSGAGTGFTATCSAGGGQGVVLIGVLYIQSAGNNGSVVLNISKGGTQTGDWNTLSAGWVALFTCLANAGLPVRRAMVWLGVNDQPNFAGNTTNTAAIMGANLVSIVGKIQAASPLTEVVLVAGYYASTVGNPGVGVATWGATWVPAIQQAAIATGSTFINMFARFGDCSSTGDPYGLTVEPGIHFGVGTNNQSTINGQQAHAELFFEKLNYSKVYQPTGVVRSGADIDGSITTQIGLGLTAGRTATRWFKKASDAQPTVVVGGTPEGGTFITPGLYTGPGGAGTPDTNLVRHATGIWANTAGTGIISGGSATNSTAAASTPTFANGTAAQLAQTTQDAEVYLVIGTPGSAFSIAIGPTAGVADTIVSSITPTAGALYRVRLPAGWFLKWSGTSTTLASQTAVTC